jgi:hypothetical protein
MLKYSPEYDAADDAELEYLNGEIYIQPFAPKASTEARIIGFASDGFKLVKYPLKKHESFYFWFNNYYRPMKISLEWFKNEYNINFNFYGANYINYDVLRMVRILILYDKKNLFKNIRKIIIDYEMSLISKYNARNYLKKGNERIYDIVNQCFH